MLTPQKVSFSLCVFSLVRKFCYKERMTTANIIPYMRIFTGIIIGKVFMNICTVSFCISGSLKFSPGLMLCKYVMSLSPCEKCASETRDAHVKIISWFDKTLAWLRNLQMIEKLTTSWLFSITCILFCWSVWKSPACFMKTLLRACDKMNMSLIKLWSALG